MASESVNINGPVRVQSDGKHSVAYNLMSNIAHHEKSDTNNRDRAYWLKLYHQCQLAVDGCSLESILKGD